MGLTTGAEALRAARWVNPIFVHYVHTFDERPWTPTAFFRFIVRSKYTLTTRSGTTVLFTTYHMPSISSRDLSGCSHRVRV